MAGLPAFKPTDEQRKTVKNAVTAGLSQVLTAKVLGISPTTLVKYFNDELETAQAHRHARAAELLWEKVEKGETACLFFYMKTQMGWRETSKLEVDATVDIKGAGVSGLLAAVAKTDAKS